MKKFMKVAKIILVVLTIIVGILLIVGYIWFKDNTIAILNSIKDFVNQPLPIIGVSSVVLCVFLYKVFIATKYGKKAISDIVSEKNKTISDIQAKESDLKEIEYKVDNKLQEQDTNINTSISEIKAYLVELCGYSRNIKAKELATRIEQGESENGKENQDSQAIKE